MAVLRTDRSRLKNTSGGFWKKPSFVRTERNTYVIPVHAAYRSDTISDEIYGTTDYDWVVMMYNDITDPFTELKAGTILNYPSIEEIGDYFANAID